ncbi:SIR2 family protein [Prosthecobacter dejongeii]|uniref:SIR2-like domain-containing protein n=1 Tax=Prosthecobacter dejongeii TaxID=48465 RepID=A0A7W7YH98_9BACT|nr:SIR2 family protein [Prosthecobacter dejongeii]MBB5036148.1 hypothetical protein [Prosthecobacter dejongeii]
MPAPSVPSDLAVAIKDKRAALFVGAGLSVAAGYPTWQGLIEGLITDAKTAGMLEVDTADKLVSAVSDPNKFLPIAQQLSDELGDADFRKRVAKAFERGTRSPTDVHRRLMSIPFCFHVTTNYDKLLEDAFAEVNKKTPDVYNYTDVSGFADALWDRRFFILKAHGDVARPSEIVLTRKDYRSLVYSNVGYRHLLASIFTNKTVLFLGASMNDPEVAQMLEALHVAFHGGGVRHYALIEKESIHDFEVDRWRKDYNVHVLPYMASTKLHPEVLEFVKNLSV